MDPRRPHQSTLPSAVGPRRQCGNRGRLIFQVSALNHHIILSFVTFSSLYDGYKLHPCGKAVTPDCLREDDYKKERKSLFIPQGETKAR